MCVICRGRFPKAELTRYCLTPEGVLREDENKNSPGRGWYICRDAQCARKFAKFRPVSRARRG
ncbi:MAG: YlxR family protein [Desulfovibrio sp.]|nr:YlxR family protein [Desulfovibrio sp.]